MKGDRGKNIILSGNFFAANKNKVEENLLLNNISSNSQTKKTNSIPISNSNSFRYKEVNYNFQTGKNSIIKFHKFFFF